MREIEGVAHLVAGGPKAIRATQAAAAGSPAGASEMKESLKIAVPWRWFGPMESNMMPPRL
jgi:hypothetical protein